MGHVLLNGVLPIFAIAVIGYIMGRRGTFTPSDAGIINRLLFMVAVPALSFKLVANAPFADFDWLLLIGFFLSELVIYALGALLAWKILKCDVRESLLLGLAASFGNGLLFVLPIATNLFGEAAIVPIIAIITLDSLLIFSATLIAMEALTSSEVSLGSLAGKILSNPPIIGLVSGIVVAFSGLQLPESVNLFLSFVGNAAAPCSLFCLGIILSQVELAHRVRESAAIVTLRLVGHPVAAWFIICVLLGFSLSEAKISMMIAAAPCGTMSFVLALNYGVRTDIIAPAILYTTLGALLTVTFVAAL